MDDDASETETYINLLYVTFLAVQRNSGGIISGGGRWRQHRSGQTWPVTSVSRVLHHGGLPVTLSQTEPTGWLVDISPDLQNCWEQSSVERATTEDHTLSGYFSPQQRVSLHPSRLTVTLTTKTPLNPNCWNFLRSPTEKVQNPECNWFQTFHFIIHLFL